MLSEAKHLHRFFPLAFCLFTCAFCQAQSDVLKYAHQIVDTLASPSMHGRGYVNKGDSIASDYIKREFEKIGVHSLRKDFFQFFQFPVITFPQNTFLSFQRGKSNFQNTTLKPGIDYLVESGSSTEISGEYWASVCTQEVLMSKNKIKKFRRNKFSSKVIIIDERGLKDKIKIRENEKWIINNSTAKSIVIFSQDKLTWTVFQKSKGIPVYRVNCADSIIIQNNDGVYCSSYSKLIPNYQSQNIIGCIKGTQYPDSFIIFSAHYDHLGQMGKDVYFPGANDNASGCAMLLNLAKYYSQHPPKYSIAFMAFGGEEVGLLGSKYYVEHPLFPLKQIKFLVNMDIMGTGDEGIKVVNATEHKKEFDELVRINTEKNLLPSVQPRGKASNSDHYFFEEAGVKTFFIYTLGGVKAYHDIYDRPETLPLTKFEEAYKLLIGFSDYLQK